MTRYLKRLALALATFATLTLPALPASADLIMPGQKVVSYCFQIANMADYPDYVFLMNLAQPVGGHQVIQQGQCVSFYKLARPVIYAIKKTDFNPAEIPDGTRDKAGEKAYFDTNPKLLRSDVSISNLNTVDEKDPRKEAKDILRIDGIGGQTLTMHKESVQYTYENGASETLPYTQQEVRPEPKSVPAPWYLYGFIAVPVLAAVGIGLILLRRRRAR